MKRYVSSVLVPWFLLQLFGCYSANEITLVEFNNEKEAVITTNDSSIYYLTKKVDKLKVIAKPKIYYSDDWLINPEEETITLHTYQATKYSNQVEGWQIKEDTTKINYGDISNLTVENFDVGKTLLYSGITLVSLLALIISAAAIALSGGLWIKITFRHYKGGYIDLTGWFFFCAWL